MRRRIASIMIIGALAGSIAAHGCSGGSGASTSTGTIVTGVAATGAPLSGTVSLKDSSNSPREINTVSAADGSYAFDVAGMTAPFMLRIEWTSGSASRQMYSLATGPGTANINPLSNAAVAVAAHISDLRSLYGATDPTTFKTLAKNIPAAVDILRAKLSPLFEQYRTARHPITDTFRADHMGMDKMFDEVTIQVSGGNIMITNHAGGIIFEAPVADVPAGTFHPENMPGMTGVTPGTPSTPAPSTGQNGALLYSTNCSGCHGTLALTGKRGATAARIQAAITGDIGGMGVLASLTAAQVQAIAYALASPMPAPAPTPAPTLDGAALYMENCGGCHGPLATSTKRGTTAARTQTAINNSTGGMGGLSTLSAAQVQAITEALSSAAPVPPPAPADGASLYATYCSSCHGTLSRSDVEGATAGEIQSEIRGTRQMSSLSGLSAAQIQAIADAL